MVVENGRSGEIEGRPPGRGTAVSARKHIRILAIVTLAWAAFWVVGLPDYYRQYSDGFMIAFDLAILFPLWYVVFRVLKRVRRHPRLAVASWLAFYITVPLLIYDALYCGVYLGYGVGFFAEFWYLSVYYVLPWIILPPTGLCLIQTTRTLSVQMESVPAASATSYFETAASQPPQHEGTDVGASC